MNVDKIYCPDCQTKLEIAPLSDLVAEKKEPSRNATLETIIKILNRFIFYVCPTCGRTLVYAVPELRRLAAEGSDEIIGHS